MTQEELYEVIRNWNDEKSGERAAVFVSVEKDGDKANSCSAVMGVTYPLIEGVAKAIEQHPDAVAILVNNPTYYGVCSDLKAIVKMAHDAGMLCLADEAHGTHFYFGENMPVTAMAAGADMAAVSMHKSGGSLTQSSFLLAGPAMQEGYIR